MTAAQSTKKPKKIAHSRDAKTNYEASPNGNSAAGRKKRDELAETLLLELRELRANLDELTEHFRLRIAGELSEIMQAIEGKGMQAKPKRPSVKLTRAMLDELERHQLKPKKGRAKDLARIQDLTRKLSALLPVED